MRELISVVEIRSPFMTFTNVYLLVAILYSIT